jgi:hypothetical protein
MCSNILATHQQLLRISAKSAGRPLFQFPLDQAVDAHAPAPHVRQRRVRGVARRHPSVARRQLTHSLKSQKHVGNTLAAHEQHISVARRQLTHSLSLKNQCPSTFTL